MRCQKCGSFMHHIITTIEDHKIYQCTRSICSGISTLDREDKDVVFSGHTTPCNHICYDNGKVVSGHIAYITDGKVKSEKIQ